ncbi:Uncharacterised protein [Mycobacteroides abscessus subsp. abscessus]|nr:Uncharacterised protein [Mycobacteroides abscessus subsp. abscessus]SLL09460.1 Uncharacterised protein [Mycobacteroides abscessus subsp. abscessus]
MMSDIEAPLTPDERLVIVSLYAHLTLSQNRSVPGRLGSEMPCYADHDICSPESLSHRVIPANRLSEGFRSC